MVFMTVPIDEAMHANVLRARLRLGSLTDRAKAERVGPWLLIDAGVDVPRFNLALAAAPIDDPVSAIAAAAEWFEARSADFCMTLRDSHERQVIEAAKAAGFVSVEQEPSMLFDSLPPVDDAAVPGGLVIREATSSEDIRRFAEVDALPWPEVTQGIVRTATAFPDFTMLLGEVDGVAAATAMTVVTTGVAGIFNVLVRADLRGRGYGRAMTLAAIEVGRRAGCTAASLQSTALGLPLYERLGFRTRYSYDTLMRRTDRDSIVRMPGAK